MTEKLLDRADVVATFQQVRREGVVKSVAGGALRNVGAAHGLPHRALKHGFVQVVATELAILIPVLTTTSSPTLTSSKMKMSIRTA